MSEARLVAVAARQAGAFSVGQSEAIGITEAVRRQNVKTGRWVVLHRGVLAVAGSADTPERRLWAGRLALGPLALASHRAGLWLWARRPGIVVHRLDDLEVASISYRRGIAVTSPLRTLVDAGAVVSRDDVEDAVDRAIARKLVTPPALLAEVGRLARCGRAGVGLVVEVDGWDCHSSSRARDYDLHRRNQIVLGNLRPLVYTYGDVVRRGSTVIEEIRAAMSLAS